MDDLAANGFEETLAEHGIALHTDSAAWWLLLTLHVTLVSIVSAIRVTRSEVTGLTHRSSPFCAVLWAYQSSCNPVRPNKSNLPLLDHSLQVSQSLYALILLQPDQATVRHQSLASFPRLKYHIYSAGALHISPIC